MMPSPNPQTEPIFAALVAEHPEVPAALNRPRWTLEAAKAQADAALMRSKIKPVRTAKSARKPS